jgi:C1A family cysteine protease
MTNATSPKGHAYNLRPSLEWVSHPELRASAHPFAAVALPPEYVFGETEPNDDQGQLGACTANMMDELLRYMQELLGLAPFQTSRLWAYWQERNLEGTTGSDAGATIADTVKVARDLGFIPETQYPYVIAQFATQPPASLLTMAAAHKNLINTTMLQTDIVTTKSFIWNNGAKPLPIAYGFAVYQQYETVKLDGMIAMPSGQALGGHANSIWGWSDSRQAWRVHNVWGDAWGDSGNAWLPYAYPRWDVWGVAPKAAPPPPPPPVRTYEQGYADAKAKALAAVQGV